MPSYKSVDSRAMIAAGESGAQMVARAREAQLQQHQSEQEQNARLAESVGRSMQVHEQQQEQVRSNLSREGEERRSNKMREAIAQDEQDISMADKGLQSSGTSRADRLRQEMARGAQQTGGQQQQQKTSPEEQAKQARYVEQADMPFEIAGPDRRTISHTPERQAAEAQKGLTDRMNAQANYMNAIRGWAQARLGGDTEGMVKNAKTLEKPIKDAAELFDAGKTGSLTDKQWFEIQEMASDLPDPELQAEVKARQFGPALTRFTQSGVAQRALKFISVTGDLPDGDLVDFSSPIMAQFTQNAMQMREYLRQADTGGILSNSLNVTSLADRIKTIRKMTAQAMIDLGATPKPMGGSLLPGTGTGQPDTPIPSQGGQGAIPAPGQQRGQPVNLEPGLTGIPPEADPNQRPGSPVQQTLEQRERRGRQQQYFEDRRRQLTPGRYPAGPLKKSGPDYSRQ